MSFKLLFIIVYLPHTDSEANSAEFSLQEQNQDYEVILGGDFNVDFSRNCCHTCLLNDLCSQMNLYPVIKHTCSIVDNTSHFSVLDHFFVGGSV